MRARTGVTVACLVLLLTLPAVGATITLETISTAFPTPIGIDHHEPTNSLVMSVNYPSGSPHNFQRVLGDGTQVPFSTVSGLTDEVKIATARTVSGSFASGTLFTGSGVDGEIVKIDPTGSPAVNPWVSLPGAGNGLMRGSLYVDRTGVYGGDLIVVTTAGEVWRINTAGIPTFIADVNTHLEGLITVPGDVSKYGPLAGKIIAGAEGSGLMYAFDSTGLVATHSVGVNIEDIDLIGANENFFGVNYGTSRLLGSKASDWTSVVGDILLTQESHTGSGLWTLRWDGTSLVSTPVALTVGSAAVGQWEHVTFSSAGVVEISSTAAVPLPSAAWAGLGLLGVMGAIRRRSRRRAAQA